MKQHKLLAIRIKKNYKKRKKAEKILSTVYLKSPHTKLPTVMTSLLSSSNKKNLFNLVEKTFIQQKEKLEIKIFFSNHCSKLTQNEVSFCIFMVS